MIVPELPPALRKAVQLVQSFSRCRVTHDIWKSNQCRMFNKRPEQTKSNDNKKPRPKTEPIPKITLLSLDNSTTVTVLEVAQRLAKRRNLTLIKVSELEDKTQRPLYKLMNNANIFEEIKEDKDVQKLRKGTKLFYITAKITEHDLWTKTKNMMKLLNMGHKVKVAITLDAADGSKVQRAIENAVRNDGSIQRMPSRKNVILLLINPLHKNKNVSVNNKDENDNSSIANNERDT
ncbi:PREDICTED: translation initiation factor IF-3, chloroplastic-like [Atta cephalotes]|uniref:Translation initiation factor 3 N-terminal domain-containing protein n=1 Tax=Atta cephalotes TaxID=12957 RepID=A0A158NWU8_ATTCE|nr:PREDICTED: translation initiation factor IF-3, chloroplastic-like [Atta cephalotes]